MREGQSLQHMMLGKPDNHMQKNETGPLSYTIQKINSKWTKDLNIRPETIKLLEDNRVGKFLEISLGNDFFGLDTKSQGNKSKNKQVGQHQTKKLLTAKETIYKMKR